MTDKKILESWKPVMIHIIKEAFTGFNRNVPGWECRKCGTQYGGVEPPEKCWKCPGEVR